MINATVQLTASHYGHFEFRLCPKSSAQELVTQECFNRNLLTLADGSTQFPISTLEAIKYYPNIQLPATIACQNCVLQWRYTVGRFSLRFIKYGRIVCFHSITFIWLCASCLGNSWGNCGNGTSAVGCGNQETFINCADIAII